MELMLQTYLKKFPIVAENNGEDVFSKNRKLICEQFEWSLKLYIIFLLVVSDQHNLSAFINNKHQSQKDNMNNNQSAEYQAGQAKAQAEEKASQLKDQASNAAQSAQDSLQQAGQQMKEKAQDAAEAVKNATGTNN